MEHVILSCLTALLTVAVLTIMSVWANRRFRGNPSLPMQWWLDGTPTWRAPRPVALAFTPVLAAIVLTAVTASTAFGKPRPGQEALMTPINLGIAVFLIAFHTGHLWAMRVTLRRERER